MADILVVYGTAYGQTAKIVERIVRRLVFGGHEVTILQRGHWPEDGPLEDFDGVLVAGSVLYGRHQRYLEKFVWRHVVQLNATPSAFLSVCGVLAQPSPVSRQEAAGQVANFLGRTGFHPRLVQSVAGAVAYTKYNWATRWMMRFISKRTGRPTDTSRDWEFTDWDQVDRFAYRFAECVVGSMEEGNGERGKREPGNVGVMPAQV